MNCAKCSHTHLAHELRNTLDTMKSLMLVGKCLIIGCHCQQYVDRIELIDEELL